MQGSAGPRNSPVSHGAYISLVDSDWGVQLLTLPCVDRGMSYDCCSHSWTELTVNVASFMAKYRSTP